jgi:hypothetical protein
MMVTDYGSLLESIRRLLNDLVPVLFNTIVLVGALGWFASRRVDGAMSPGSARRASRQRRSCAVDERRRESRL